MPVLVGPERHSAEARSWQICRREEPQPGCPKPGATAPCRWLRQKGACTCITQSWQSEELKVCWCVVFLLLMNVNWDHDKPWAGNPCQPSLGGFSVRFELCWDCFGINWLMANYQDWTWLDVHVVHFLHAIYCMHLQVCIYKSRQCQTRLQNTCPQSAKSSPNMPTELPQGTDSNIFDTFLCSN